MPTEEERIFECIQGHRSFFLMAGAGAGKTWALKETLGKLSNGSAYSHLLLNRGQRIAAITYTNNAAGEIQRRVDNDPVFWISTIHAFAWECIHPYFENIRSFLIDVYFAPKEKDSPRKNQEKNENREKIRAMKATSFVYNPFGANEEANSLQHDEVISTFAWFLENEPEFQSIFMSNFPIVFIDECQDTDKRVIDALLALLQKNKERFLLGMFGDILQTIYLNGEPDLQQKMDETGLVRIDKTVNHRSGERIIQLGNSIRALCGRPDEIQTKGDQNVGPGLVRFFIIPQENYDFEIEKKASQMMKSLVGDGWDESNASTKNLKYPRTLALTHKMAARRGGFINLFSSFSTSQKESMGDENSSVFSFLKDYVVRLYEAYEKEDYYLMTGVIQSQSNPVFFSHGDGPQLFQSVLEELNHPTGDCSIRSFVAPFLKKGLLSLGGELTEAILNPDGTDQDQRYLDQSVAEAKNLVDHYRDDSLYFTQQGVKGLEFDNVIVIINDFESAADRYNSFKYGYLFDSDPTHIRNKYLFYVQCTRAKKALAVMAYVNPAECESFKNNLLKNYFALEGEMYQYSSEKGIFCLASCSFEDAP